MENLEFGKMKRIVSKFPNSRIPFLTIYTFWDRYYCTFRFSKSQKCKISLFEGQTDHNVETMKNETVKMNQIMFE